MNDTITETSSASGGFEQRLLQELLAEVRENPGRETAVRLPLIRHHRRRLATTGVLAAVAVTASVALPILLGGHSSDKAYAVTPQSDGSVTVTIYRFDDAAGLQAQLAADGVSAVVDYLPVGKACRQSQFTHADAPFGIRGSGSSGPGGVTLSFTLSPSQIAGHTFVLEYSGSTAVPTGARSMSTLVALATLATGPVAPCVLVDAPSGNPPAGAGNLGTTTGHNSGSGTQTTGN